MNEADGPHDRASGALVGLAIGDALGAPLVGLTRPQAHIKHGTVDTFLGGGQLLVAPGEGTARVDMVRAAAVALLGPSPFVGAAFADRVVERYLQVLASGRPGLGEATRASLERIRDGEKREEAARIAHDALERKSAGIGAALRAVPFALRLADEDALATAVLADASLTHADPRAGAAALALALWVRVHLDGEDDPARAVERVRERMGERPELPDVLPSAAAVRALPVRTTAYAPDVLHAALRHALDAKSARRALIGAVNEAGASAALGAATGAVVGARFGLRGLDERWVALLQGGAAWRTLAERLVDARHEG